MPAIVPRSTTASVQLGSVLYTSERCKRCSQGNVHYLKAALDMRNGCLTCLRQSCQGKSTSNRYCYGRATCRVCIVSFHICIIWTLFCPLRVGSHVYNLPM